jgi:hypothetical protein
VKAKMIRHVINGSGQDLYEFVNACGLLLICVCGWGVQKDYIQMERASDDLLKNRIVFQ